MSILEFKIFYILKRNYFLSGGGDNLIRVWDQRNYNPIAILEGHDGVVFCLESIFFNNTYLIVSGGKDARMIVWNLDTMKNIGSYQPFDSGVTYLRATSTYGSFMAISRKLGVYFELAGTADYVEFNTIEKYDNIIEDEPCKGLKFYNGYLILSSSRVIVEMDFKSWPATVYQRFLTSNTQSYLEIADGKFFR